MTAFTDTSDGSWPADPELAGLVRAIDARRDRQLLYLDRPAVLLSRLAAQSRFDSVVASNAIARVVLADAVRIVEVFRSTSPRAHRDGVEGDFAGYRDALDHVVGMDAEPLDVSRILRVHRLLRRHAGDLSEGIAAGDQAPGRLAPLVERYEGALAARRHPPLLLICALSLDFLVAHPFEIGSGRMTRLLVIHELLRHDYEVARYISLERRILDTTSEHDAALQASREPDGRLDPLPWARYLLSTVAAAYAELEARLAADGELLGMSKRDQARSYVLAHAPQRFPLAQMDIALPDISRATVRDALQQLCREGRLRVDAGPSAMWERIG